MNTFLKTILAIVVLLSSFSTFGQATRGLKTISSKQKLNYGFKNEYALIIGINEYRSDDIPNLKFAQNDAKAIKDMLITTQNFETENIISLYDQDATKSKILSAFDYLQNECTEDDKVFVFYAGHGKTKRVLGGVEKGYILPYDASISELTSTAISTDQLNEFSSTLLAKHVFFAMDACYGGNVVSRSVKESGTTAGLIDVLSSRIARQAMTAGGADQEVLDGGPNGHSVFTYHFLAAIQKKLADYNGDKVITTSELASYLLPAVSQESNMAQTPEYGPMKGNRGGEYFFLGPDRTSKLKIESNIQNARVYVDGIEVGFTPLEVVLDKGEHKISINNNDLVVKDTSINLEIDLKIYIDLTTEKKKEFASSFEKNFFIKNLEIQIRKQTEKQQYFTTVAHYKTLYRVTKDEKYLDSAVRIQSSKYYKNFTKLLAAEKNGNRAECAGVLAELEKEHLDNLEVILIRNNLITNRKRKSKQFVQLKKKHGDDPLYVYSSLEKSIEAKNYKVALKTVNKLLSLDPDNAIAYHIKGLINIKNENPTEAITNMKRANELSDTIFTQNYFEISQVYYNMNKYSESVSVLKEAFSYGVKSAKFYYLLGLNEVKQKRIRSAATHFEYAIQNGLAPKYKGFLSIQSQEDMSNGLLLLSKGLKREALQSLSYSLTYNPLNYAGYITRARLYHSMYSNINAFNDIDRAIAIDPNRKGAYLLRRDINLVSGSYENVIKDANFLIQLDNEDEVSHGILGIAQYHLRNYEQSIINLKKALAYGHKTDTTYYYLGSSMLHLSKFNSALQYANSGLKKNKYNRRLWYLKGESLLRQRNYSSALQSFSKANKIDPNRKLILFMMGLCSEKMEEYKDAIHYYQEAKYIDAKDPSLLTHLALCYNKTGNPRDALANYEMAYMADTSVAHSAQFCSEVAYLYLDKKDFRQSLIYFLKLKLILNDNWTVKYGMAKLYAYQNNPDMAIRFLEEAMVGANVSLYKKTKKSKYFAPIKKNRAFKKQLKMYK